MSRFVSDSPTAELPAAPVEPVREERRRRDSRMRFTPLDIQSHRFGRALRGYDADEVESFLRLVAEDLERSVREADELRDKARELETRVNELQDREETLKRTLMTAQQLSEDLRNTAAREAEVTVAEAEVKAEKLMDAAHRRLAKLSEDIREIRSLRTRLGGAVRTTIETHLALLEGLSEDPEEDPLFDGKVTYLPRAASQTKGPAASKGESSEGGAGEV